MITEQDWAYFAGIIDGEGSIVLHRDRRNSRVWGEIQVYNTSEDLINWLLDRFGGRFYVCSQSRRQASKFGNSLPIFTIRWNGQISKDMIPRLLPYLVALTEVSGYGSTNRNDKNAQLAVYEKFKSLAEPK